MPSLKSFGPSATDMIRADHTRVMALFHRYKANAGAMRKKALFAMIRGALLTHARIEEEIFYPAMRAAGSTLLDELEPEHQEMRSLLAQLSVTVREVLPNGDLTVFGEQLLVINEEQQRIDIEGRVRRQDISENNVVLSTRLADARITYVGEGDVAQRQKPGWWHHLLDLFGL